VVLGVFAYYARLFSHCRTPTFVWAIAIAIPVFASQPLQSRRRVRAMAVVSNLASAFRDLPHVVSLCLPLPVSRPASFYLAASDTASREWEAFATRSRNPSRLEDGEGDFIEPLAKVGPDVAARRQRAPRSTRQPAAFRRLRASGASRLRFCRPAPEQVRQAQLLDVGDDPDHAKVSSLKRGKTAPTPRPWRRLRAPFSRRSSPSLERPGWPLPRPRRAPEGLRACRGLLHRKRRRRSRP
jgi:hypothetical protein